MSDIREFRLPDLGEGLEEGEIVQWLVAVGDQIELNQEVASVETAKAVVDVPSPFAGTVVELIGDEGATIEVGEVFVRIDVSGGAVTEDGGDDAATDAASADAPTDAAPTEDTPADSAPASASTGLDADSEPQPLVGYGNREGTGRRRRRGGAAADTPADDIPPDGSPAAAGGGSVLAKPPVRKLARDLGVDLAAIAPGSGEGGVITREDVRMAAARTMVAEQAPPPKAAQTQPSAAMEPAEGTRRSSVIEALVAAPGGAGEKPVPGFRGRRPGEVEKVAGIRKRIIAKMEQSRRDIPHALCSRDADLTELWHLRRDLTEQAHAQGLEVRISPTALVMRATLLALRRFPTLNAIYDQDAGEIRLLEHIHLGCAVDTDRGLMVPNVKDAHTKSLVQIAAETEQLAQACRDGSATPAQLTGGTFTVDNYGSFGNDDGNPIINAPEVGILGIGVIRERPWVVDGDIVARRVARFTLAFDHRVCDGGEAGRFVTYVADLCEQPSRILLHA